MSSEEDDQSSSSQSEEEVEQDQEVSDHQDDGVAPAKAAGKPRKKREPAASGGKRKKRDPKKPKGPLTPYMFFGKVMRPQLAEESKGATFAELGKKLGELWGALPAAEKAPYEQKAKADKIRFKTEMESYVEPEDSGDEADQEGDKKKKRKKDPNEPKRPLSAFLIYSNEVRAEVKKEHPNDKIGDIAKKIGLKWGALSDEEKKPYQVKQAGFKATYDVAKAEFQETKPSKTS